MTTIKYQPKQSAFLDILPRYLTTSNCMQNLRRGAGGQNVSFPTLLDSYRELLSREYLAVTNLFVLYNEKDQYTYLPCIA